VERLAVYAAFVGAVEGDVERRHLSSALAARSTAARERRPFRVADRAGRPRVARSGPHALHVARRLPAHCIVAMTVRDGKRSRNSSAGQVQRVPPAPHAADGSPGQHRNVAVACGQEAVLWA